MATSVLASVVRQGALTVVPVAIGLESAAFSALLGGPEFAAWRARWPIRTPPPELESPVAISLEGDLLTIVLNRPERRNAFSASMRDALVDALEVGLLDTKLTVQLRGNGPVFSSGGDLDE